MKTSQRNLVENISLPSEIRRMNHTQDKEYSNSISSKRYSTFAEMYLEEPSDIQTNKASCTVCTWRNVPTIDDW